MDEIKLDFLESLKDLTFNSRPIIQTLTTIAAENKQFAPAIAEAIEQHSLACPPNHKLPAIYLVDSICKNVRAPYADVFASKIYRIFTETFKSVAEPVRIKLGELFNTWTVPSGPNGNPLFPHEVLQQIDQFLAKMRGGGPAQNSAPRRVNQTVLLVEVNQLLKQVLALDPGREADNQKAVLERLQGALAQPGVDPSIFPTIQNQLEEFRGRIAYLQSRPKRDRDRDHGRGDRGGPMRKRRDDRKPYDRDDWGSRRSGGSGGPGSSVDSTGANQVPLGPRRPAPEPAAAVPNLDFSAIAGATNGASNGDAPPFAGIDFAALAQSIGVLKQSGTPEPGSQPASQVASQAGAGSDPSLPSILSNLQKSGLVNLGVTLELTTAALSTPHPELIAELYENLPVQSVTGRRFPDTPEGHEAKQREMDWHFRVNRDLREGRSRNRCWFLTADEWIAYKDEEEVEGYEQPAESKEPKVDLEAEAAKYVVVPADTTSDVCPVCQEKFQTVYSEEAEEWVWTNAVEVEGHIFNATCYADPNNQQVVKQILST